MSENNALVIKARSRDEAVEAASEGVASTEADSTAVRSIRFLRDSVHFGNYASIVIEAEISRERSRLESERDPVEVYRIQGAISGLERARNLDRAYKNYQSRIDRKNHGKGETK